MLVYTDGSALNNSKEAPAGWACLFVFDDGKTILRSGNQKSTNNAAEIQAISYALWYSVNKLTLKDEDLLIKSDSEYAIKVITGINKAKANAKAISVCQKLIKELKLSNVNVKFDHVMAHTGGSDDDSKYNDIVDKEARRQATLMQSDEPKNDEIEGDLSLDERVVYISKKIPKYQIFMKLYKRDGINVKEIDLDEIKHKRINSWMDTCIINHDEISEFKSIEKHMMYYVISHAGVTYDSPFIYPCLEVTISKNLRKYMKYGSFAKTCYCCSAPTEQIAYEWFYECNEQLMNFNHIDSIPGLLLQFDANQFMNQHFRLNKILGEVARRNKTTFTSTEIKPISYGSFNIVYDISSIEPESILRIHVNKETQFDANSCELLSKIKDSGFVPVRYYDAELGYSILAKCEPIKESEFDVTKYRNMLDKIRKTISANKSLVLVDYHKGNIMQLNDEYVYVDIDLNMIDLEWIISLKKCKSLSEIMDKTIVTTFSIVNYVVVILKSMGFEVNLFNISMLVLELSYMSGGERTIMFTQEVYDELKKRLSADFN